MKGIWKYDHLLPWLGQQHRVTLGEGDTPLVRSRHIGPMIGIAELYFKLELTNPTGSYKDRFAAAALSFLTESGARQCFATSSGNTGAALAAYSAAVGIPCFLAIVDGAPEGKLSQMEVYGAHTLMIRSFGKDANVSSAVMSGLNALADRNGSPVQISAYKYSAAGMAGVQTIAYEIAEELNGEALNVFSPAGGGGLTLAVLRGFQTWKENSVNFVLPRVHCVQPAGNNTICGPLREGKKHASAIGASTTTVSGLQVPNVLDGDRVIEGCRASGGGGHVVDDADVYQCQHALAVKEGIFCEPAGAVALAGLQRAVREGMVAKGERVVCLITGHGFKSITGGGVKTREVSTRRFFETPEDAFAYVGAAIDG